MSDASIASALESLAAALCGGGNTATYGGVRFGLVVETGTPALESAVAKALEGGPALVIAVTRADPAGEQRGARAISLKYTVSVGIYYVPELHAMPAAALTIAIDYAQTLLGLPVSEDAPGLRWNLTGLQPLPDDAPMAGWQILCEITLPFRK